jgi:hypothetical protein
MIGSIFISITNHSVLENRKPESWEAGRLGSWEALRLESLEAWKLESRAAGIPAA